MADYAPTAADIRDFVENIETAAGYGNPNLGEWWDIITLLHKDLLYPNTRTIRPFAEFQGIQPRYRVFAVIAYEWLVTNHKQGTVREAIGKIGHTKPGLTATITEGIAEHELSTNLRKVRVAGADQSPHNTITSLAEFWAAERTLKRLSQRTPLASTIADIPRTYEQMLPYVNEMKLLGQGALSLSQFADPFDWNQNLATQAFLDPVAAYPVGNHGFTNGFLNNANEASGNDIPIDQDLTDSNTSTSNSASLEPVPSGSANSSDLAKNFEGAYGVGIVQEDHGNPIEGDGYLQGPDSGDPFDLFDTDAFVMGTQQAPSGDDGHNSTGDGFVHFQDTDEDYNDELSGDRAIDDYVAGTSASKRKRDKSDEEGSVGEQSPSKRLR